MLSQGIYLAGCIDDMWQFVIVEGLGRLIICSRLFLHHPVKTVPSGDCLCGEPWNSNVPTPGCLRVNFLCILKQHPCSNGYPTISTMCGQAMGASQLQCESKRRYWQSRGETKWRRRISQGVSGKASQGWMKAVVWQAIGFIRSPWLATRSLAVKHLLLSRNRRCDESSATANSGL